MSVLMADVKRLVSVLLAMFFFPYAVCALTVEDLDAAREWHIKTLTITGNEHLSTNELTTVLATKTRPWYIPWRSYPVFEPTTFSTDLENVVRFYQAKGYYEATVAYELDVAGDLVSVHLSLTEGKPVMVAQLTLTISDQPALAAVLETQRGQLPLVQGMIFDQDRYQETEEAIKEFFFAQHRGRVRVERKAEVIVDQQVARVHYLIEAGPPTVFGETQVEGTKNVAPDIVTRELAYKPGEPFSPKPLATARQNLVKLDLFSSIQFTRDDSSPDPTVIPMRVRVEEKPPREWKLGIGYGTEDQVRGQARWRHNNWLGGGRRLEAQVKLSAIHRSVEASFLQPHFLSPQNRFLLSITPQQLDEPGYLLNLTRFQPRFERVFSEQLSGSLAYRLEYDQLSNISRSTIRALQGLGPEPPLSDPILGVLFPPPAEIPKRAFHRKGVLSGFAVGVLWNGADDPLNPTTGGVASLNAEQVGEALGGDFHFYKLQGETKWYFPLAEQMTFASRLKLGFAEPLGAKEEVPLFERFYAGGSNSVRGYDRYRLGPLSASDDPLGGRSLIEGALEVRRQLTTKFGAAVFFDFGQVDVRSFQVPVDDLEYAAGFGVRYVTVAGPLRLDFGFPFAPPGNDQPWQIHFSIGQAF